MTRSITFGRGPGADHLIDEPNAEPVHCRISDWFGRWYVEDLGTTHGTWVRRGSTLASKVAGATEIWPGDKVIVGRTTLPWEAQ